jgi:phage recombination protein Bet
MSNGAMTTTSAVDQQVAEAMALQGRLDPLRDALGLTDLTDAEMSLFAMVALHSRLDPFAKQIYAIRRKGKITFQTGIDGFRSSAEDTDQYRGSEEPTFGPTIDEPFPHPEWAQVTVRRQLPNGDRFDQSATARWAEFFPGTGPDGFMWVKMPFSQLAKCAEAQAFRKGFPRRFGQVYVTEEMQQADAAEHARPVEATVTTHRDQIAAERARLEARSTSVPASADESGAGQGIQEPAAADPSPAPPKGAGEGDASVLEGQATEVEPVQCASTSPYEGATRCGGVEGHSGLHRSKATKESWR